MHSHLCFRDGKIPGFSVCVCVRGGEEEEAGGANIVLAPGIFFYFLLGIVEGKQLMCYYLNLGSGL